MKLLSVITSVFLACALSAHASVVFVDPGFDGSFDDDGNGTQTLQTSTGEWLNDVEVEYENWVIADGAANLGADTVDGTDRERARALAQSVFDNQTNTGLFNFQFDIKISATPVAGNDDLAVYLLGWNDGQTSPQVDLANSNDAYLNLVFINGASSLLGGNEIILVNDGVTAAATDLGIAADNTFDSVSIEVDLGVSGYDYYAVVFTGESDSDVEFSIDNVGLVAVPELSAFGLLASCFGLACVMVRRRG
ncbi:hypothetical protein [Coraliomargarita sinensis]|nr:hypothetical protein [Coraliomargarita sinensis]